MRYICTSIVATLVLAGTSLPVWAVDCYFPNTKELFVADSPNDSEFGSDIATSGSRILVGRTAAWYPDFPIGGGAHIYERQADNTWLSIAILGASDATQDDQFGFSVALDGDTAVVSAPGNGSAYVYQRQADDSWLESAKLTAVGPGETMRQVAISDGVVLMSCYRYSENHCEGYPCNESPSCPAGEIADCHGNCVPAYWVGDQFCDNGAFSWNGIPIYLNCALHNCDQYTCDYNTDCDGIGDQPGACCMGTSCLPMTEADCQLAGGTYLGSRDVLGRVYVYERQSDGNWVATATLQPPMGTSGAYFGWGSIALSGNVAVIGSHADATNGRLSGCAFVYERQGNGQWLMTAKLTASDGDRFAQLGRSVSVSDDIVVVGAPDDDIGGSAYVFERQENGAWLETAKLLASDVENDDHFGWDVSISNQIATIGAMADDDVGINCGSLHVFERLPDASWLATSKLTPPDGGDYDLFGRGCALSGDILAVSSYGQQSGTTSGTVYVYERQTLDCNANGCGDWSDILNGTSLDCNANTLPDECDIDNGTVEDCDEDGVPDSCALADGDVPDCNLNGVPDSCDIANGGDADGDGYLDECKIWTVDDDGPADFDTIQAAVDHATDGNEIVVMPGVYTGSGDQVVATFDKSYLIIRASGSVEETIIDGEGQRRCIAGNSGSYEGFTIRGGWTDGDGVASWATVVPGTACTSASASSKTTRPPRV